MVNCLFELEVKLRLSQTYGLMQDLSIYILGLLKRLSLTFE
jgi:hypothetical protein